MIAGLLRAFGFGQGRQRIFTWFQLLNTIICTVVVVRLMGPEGLGYFGWIISRTLFNLMQLTIGIWILILGKAHFREIISNIGNLKGLKDFFLGTLKYTAAAYGELFGILVCFLLNLRTASADETSAFAVCIITIGLIYGIGANFASSYQNII